MQTKDAARDALKAQSHHPAPGDDAVLTEIPPDRREFVKRMLMGAGVGLAVITSLYIPDVMAHRRGSPNGYD